MKELKPEVLYKDEDIIVVDKPAGMVVFSPNEKEGSVAKTLSESFPEIKGLKGERCGAVHRLDKETSGVLLFARNKYALNFLQKELLEQKAKKRYITLVFKKVKRDKGKIHTGITRSPKDRRKQKACTKEEGKREAITFFRVLKRFSSFSLLDVQPKTGRKHQIRCHLAHIGHPVAGDRLYRFKDQKDPAELKRQFLHAASMEIKVPGGKKLFRASLPEDLKKVLAHLS